MDVSGTLGLSCGGDAVDSSTSFCTALLAKRKLALVPGDAFGAPDGVRISYAASEAELTTALAARRLRWNPSSLGVKFKEVFSSNLRVLMQISAN